MNILGINAYYHDTSAALVIDGTLVAAVEEERFTRVKHDTAFPVESMKFCLAQANLSIEDIDHIAIGRNPKAHLWRRIAFGLGTRTGRRMARAKLSRYAEILKAKGGILEGLGLPERMVQAKVHFVEHHLAHMAASYYVCPFDRAAVLSIDGIGDMVSGMWGLAEGERLRVLGHVPFPHSLGWYYQTMTNYLGFHKYGDEYKVMGLASYGEPEYLHVMRNILHNDGMRYWLDKDYFQYQFEDPSMTWVGGTPVTSPLRWAPIVVERLGEPRTGPSEPIEPRHQNIASSMQRRLEEVELSMLRTLHRLTGVDTLILSGGVALNCVVNGKIFRETPFRDLYIQPAPYDGGNSIGAAFYVYHSQLGQPRSFVMDHAYWGPEFGTDRCRRALEANGLVAQQLPEEELISRTADRLAAGKIVGWFQGRMEFGPRALGNRSILADPRRREIKDTLNARIKHREPFRPFAPSILEEATGTYFDQDYPSPFMLLTYDVRPERRGEIPAPTHVDGTGRLQTVRRDQNQKYYDLIKAFGKRTGVPVVLNTSFNENEPICCTPEEALDTFRRTNMDVLVLGDLFIEKAPASEAETSTPTASTARPATTR
jgi:carbamoyltransferase